MVVTKLLSRKIGQLTTSRITAIEQLDSAQLLALAERTLTLETIADLDAWLAQAPTMREASADDRALADASDNVSLRPATLAEPADRADRQE